MNKLQQLQLKQHQLRQKLKGLFDSHRDETGNIKDTLPSAEVKTLNTELEQIGSDIANEEQIIRLAKETEEAIAAFGRPAAGHVHNGETKGMPGPMTGVMTLSHSAPVTSFRAVVGKPDAHLEKAYRFGRWYHATIGKSADSQEWCRQNGIEIKSQFESGNPASGGYVVPGEFALDIIWLREKYGVFRNAAFVTSMASDTKHQPRRKGRITTYYVGEGKAPTADDIKFDGVNLRAKKLAALIVMSSEFDEDSFVDMGNLAAQEIAEAFALAEDDAGFIGDGGTAYGGMVGILTKLKALSGTIANIAGLVVGAGNLWSELTLADHLNVVGLLPQYADNERTAWYCNKLYYYAVMLPLAIAAGGTSMTEVINGIRTPMFMGYPVKFVQNMPKAQANSQIPVIFGDISLAATMGERRGVTIAVSEHVKFTEDEIVLRGTQRYDINVHDVGNAAAVAADKVVGPVVGLITAAA